MNQANPFNVFNAAPSKNHMAALFIESQLRNK